MFNFLKRIFVNEELEDYKKFLNDIFLNKKFSEEEKAQLKLLQSNNLMRLRGKVSECELMEFPLDSVNLNFKENEKLFFVGATSLIKKKRVTKRINYSGMTYSFRIAKEFIIV